MSGAISLILLVAPNSVEFGHNDVHHRYVGFNSEASLTASSPSAASATISMSSSRPVPDATLHAPEGGHRRSTPLICFLRPTFEIPK